MKAGATSWAKHCKHAPTAQSGKVRVCATDDQSMLVVVAVCDAAAGTFVAAVVVVVISMRAPGPCAGGVLRGRARG